MIKDPAAPYKYDRSNAWLKVKKIDTLDLPIVGASEGNGRLRGSLGSLHVEYKGVVSGVGTGLDDPTRQRLWAMLKSGNLIGKIVEVMTQEITPDGALRFPVFVRLREDR